MIPVSPETLRLILIEALDRQAERYDARVRDLYDVNERKGGQDDGIHEYRKLAIYARAIRDEIKG